MQANAKYVRIKVDLTLFDIGGILAWCLGEVLDWPAVFVSALLRRCPYIFKNYIARKLLQRLERGKTHLCSFYLKFSL